MWPEDGKNRKRGRAAFEEVPALRRESGSAFLRPGNSIQRLRLVCNRLRRGGKPWGEGGKREGGGRARKKKKREKRRERGRKITAGNEQQRKIKEEKK